MPSVLAVINPIAIKIGPLTVHWYAITTIGAIALAIWMVVREARRVGLSADFALDMVTWIVPFSILGARLYEVFVLNWVYYSKNLSEIPQIWHGGQSIHGGVIAGALTGIIFCLRRGQPAWKWADVVMPAVLAAQALGRWGNFINQEAYGTAAPDWVVHLMPAWMRNQMTIEGVVHHPTFFYESVLNLIGALVLFRLRRRTNWTQGTIALLYVVIYSVIRFSIEGIRMDSTLIPWLGNLRVAQLAGLILVPAALVLMYMRAKNGAPRYLEPVQEQQP